MADVRSMLRSELAARGKQSAPTSKKRKSADDTPIESTRPKKSRNIVAKASIAPPTVKHSRHISQHVASPPDLETVLEEVPEDEPAQPSEDAASHGAREDVGADTAEGIDEAEWAAFERDVATPEPTARLRALTAAATVEAQPMSAEQLAAQAREQESSQRGKRDVEAEEEKEEAQRQLEDELDEMEGYEERARKLRERREKLRQGVEAQQGDERDRGFGGTAISERTAEPLGADHDTKRDEDSEDESESEVEWGIWAR